MLTGKRIAAVLALLSPLAIYPILLVFSIIYDAIMGDRLLQFALEYGSRDELLRTILSDWRDALPAGYLLSIIAGAAVYGWQRLGGRRPFGVFIASAGFTAGLTAGLASDSIHHPLVWIAVLSGVVWAASSGALIKRLSGTA